MNTSAHRRLAVLLAAISWGCSSLSPEARLALQQQAAARQERLVVRTWTVREAVGTAFLEGCPTTPEHSLGILALPEAGGVAVSRDVPVTPPKVLAVGDSVRASSDLRGAVVTGIGGTEIRVAKLGSEAVPVLQAVTLGEPVRLLLQRDGQRFEARVPVRGLCGFSLAHGDRPYDGVVSKGDGSIVISASLLESLDSRSITVAVAHELAHRRLGHERKATFGQAMASGMRTANCIANLGKPNSSQSCASDPIADEKIGRYSADQERAADELATTRVAALGIDRQAYGQAWLNVASLSTAKKRSNFIGAQHPLNAERKSWLSGSR